MEHKKSDKQVYVSVPDWVKAIKDDDVAASIMALIHDWNFSGEDKISNLREYIKESFDDLSDKQVEEVAKLLIEHKVLEK